MAGELIQPLRGAIGLALRRPSLIAWIVVVAMSVGAGALEIQAFADADSSGPSWPLYFLLGFGPHVMSALIVFFLARSLLTEASHYGRPLYARFVGIYVLAVILVSVVQIVGQAAILAAVPSPGLLPYALPLASALGSVAVFPLFIRSFATAAGIVEPRLGSVWAFVFDAGRGALFWYVASTLAFDVLSAFTFANLLSAGEGYDLPGSLVQSAISATSQIMRCMLDIVAVKMMTRGWRDEAEVFA